MTNRKPRFLVLSGAVGFVLTFTLTAQVTQQQQPPPTQGGRQGQPPAGRQGGGRNPFPRPQQLSFPTEAQTLTTTTATIRVVPVVGDLAFPWSLAFLPNGDILVTEKPGRLRLVRNGKLEPEPVSGTPAVVAMGQGGLMEVALHPKF